MSNHMILIQTIGEFMQKGSCIPAGVRIIAIALLIGALFLPGALGAGDSSNSTDNITINATLPAESPTVSPQPTAPPAESPTVSPQPTAPPAESPTVSPQPTAPEVTTPLLPYPPPELVLIRTETSGMTTTVFGTVIPGSLNATITEILWDWGDNSIPENHEFPYYHSYRNPGTYTLSVTAFQSDGQNSTETETVAIESRVVPEIPVITNQVPFQPAGPGSQVSAPALTLLEPVIDGTNVTVNGNLDPGFPGVTISSVSIDWDDGNVTNVTALPATYRYAAAGIFTVNITGIQSDGQSTTKGITVDIRSDNPGPPVVPTGSTHPQDDQSVYLIILLTAVVVVLIVGIGQWLVLRKRDGSAEPDIPKAVSLQEEMYYEAKEKGDLATAAASAHVCARMFRSLAEKSPKMRTIYLELAEKWETIAQTTGKKGSAEQNPPKVEAASERIPSREELEQICAGTDVAPEVVESVIRVAMEIGREGREGQAVGTSFVVGDTDAVMNNSRQFVLNPFHGHDEAARQITETGIRGNIKEFAQLDGAFIVSGNGVVESAGRYITVDMSQVKIPDGLGARHSSIAGITMVTSSIGIVVSQSGGLITIFRDGKIVQTIGS